LLVFLLRHGVDDVDLCTRLWFVHIIVVVSLVLVIFSFVSVNQLVEKSSISVMFVEIVFII